METTNKTTRSGMMPVRRVRRPLVDYKALDEARREEAQARGEKVSDKPIPDPVIGKEHPYGKKPISPVKLETPKAKSTGATKTKPSHV